MLSSELANSINFEDISQQLPEYFKEADLLNIEKALQKLNIFKDSYYSLDEVLAKEQFNYEEVSSLALWKASYYYSQCPAKINGTEEKVFLAILNRYTQHFLDLAGKR